MSADTLTAEQLAEFQAALARFGTAPDVGTWPAYEEPFWCLRGPLHETSEEDADNGIGEEEGCPADIEAQADADALRTLCALGPAVAARPRPGDEAMALRNEVVRLDAIVAADAGRIGELEEALSTAAARAEGLEQRVTALEAKVAAVRKWAAAAMTAITRDEQCKAVATIAALLDAPARPAEGYPHE